MSSIISPTLFQIHPSENIYWTNYVAPSHWISSGVSRALANFPLLCPNCVYSSIIKTGELGATYREPEGRTGSACRISHLLQCFFELKSTKKKKTLQNLQTSFNTAGFTSNNSVIVRRERRSQIYEEYHKFILKVGNICKHFPSVNSWLTC